MKASHEAAKRKAVQLIRADNTQRWQIHAQTNADKLKSSLFPYRLMVRIITCSSMLLLYGWGNLSLSLGLTWWLFGWVTWVAKGKGEAKGWDGAIQTRPTEPNPDVNPRLVTAKWWGLSSSAVCRSSHRWKKISLSSLKSPREGGAQRKPHSRAD